jgi:hypothetical protein
LITSSHPISAPFEAFWRTVRSPAFVVRSAELRTEIVFDACRTFTRTQLSSEHRFLTSCSGEARLSDVFFQEFRDSPPGWNTKILGIEEHSITRTHQHPGSSLRVPYDPQLHYGPNIALSPAKPASSLPRVPHFPGPRYHKRLYDYIGATCSAYMQGNRSNLTATCHYRRLVEQSAYRLSSSRVARKACVGC